MNEMEVCARCGRKLKTQKSIDQGYGPVCHKKHLKAIADAEFEKNQVTIYEVLQEEGA